MMMPSGFTYGSKKLSDDTVMWFLRRHGKDVTNGTAPTLKAAEAMIKKALGEQAVEMGKKILDRSRLQMAMKRYLTRRIYLTSYVFKEAMDGTAISDIVAGAAEGEVDWHDREEKRAGMAWPLSKHHSVKPARDAAEAIIALMKQLGLTKREKILAYARKHVGPAFIQGGDINDVAAMNEAAEAAKREDDSRQTKRSA